MPSRSNPNMPSKAKRKTASVLKNKRKNNQRLASNKVSKQTVPRTSQALRQAAPLSGKKARKLMKKKGYTQQRKELEQYLEAEVEMKDIGTKTATKQDHAGERKAGGAMDVD
ncbi:MAG: hypothetical protein L6R38_009109 [Xanthoria sp. 2 TBL-2021]|nr:MAG: hypothetical protein L6R38_009109 [Xanthoria sp. 2 TBL-2021]